ncbi:MAG: tight adherence protein [Solirubrobacteraceae bacterium]|jgi:tight adherence protein B|nr:tight adherence protein [Solirubrobacteraceae bacterium]
MSASVPLAGVAGCLAVLAAWEALATVERVRLAAAAARALAPLVRARNEGRAPTAPERRRLALLSVATLLAGGWLVGGPLAGAVLATGGPWLAVALVRARRRRYLAELGRGAPFVARALADALAGGHSIRGAIGEAARGGGVPGPAGTALRAAAGDLELGERTDVMLDRLRRVAGGDHAGGVARDGGVGAVGARAFDTIVAAISLQRRAGGDLARLLREVAAAVEDAIRLDADARAATAQARFTGLLVAALPLAAAALAELGSPGYLGSLVRSPISAWLAGCAAAFALGGLLLIQRMARVRG